MFWSQHLGCWGQNTSRIQNKGFYATLCLQAINGWFIKNDHIKNGPNLDAPGRSPTDHVGRDKTLNGQYWAQPANDTRSAGSMTGGRVSAVLNAGARARTENGTKKKSTHRPRPKLHQTAVCVTNKPTPSPKKEKQTKKTKGPRPGFDYVPVAENSDRDKTLNGGYWAQPSNATRSAGSTKVKPSCCPLRPAPPYYPFPTRKIPY